MEVIARHDSAEAISWWGSEIATSRLHRDSQITRKKGLARTNEARSLINQATTKSGGAQDDTRLNIKEQKLSAVL
jgi:hypothetical protein